MNATAKAAAQHTVDIAGRALGRGWDADLTLKAEVADRARRHAQALDRLRSRKSRSGGQQRRLEYHVLRDRNAMFCSLLLAWPEYLPPVGYVGALQLCASLNARRDCGEAVKVFFRAKPGGGRRMLMKFGPQRRTLQRLAVDVLRASHGESRFDYCREGRGATRAMLAKIYAVERGARWFSTSDIKDCYGSFDREGVIALLPLPRSIVENCFLISPATHIHGLEEEEEREASEKAARRGIPQGSLASPFIAAMLLSPVLEHPTGKLVLVHGDDIVTGTKTRAECEANAHALAEACLKHPAGPLIMKHNVVTKMGSPIEALGYRMVWRYECFGGGVRFRPSSAAFEKFYTRLEDQLFSEGLSDDLLDRALAKAREWAAGLPLWDRSSTGDDIVWTHIVQEVVGPVRARLKKAAGVGVYATHGSG